MSVDLFGQPLPPPPAVDRHGKPKRKPTMANGYAAPPGTGPACETCRSCAHSTLQGGTAGRYWKCALVKSTRGPGTDIRLKSPACRYWCAQESPNAGRRI